MKIVTIRDFRTRPREVRRALEDEREAVLTVSGRPVVLMISVDAGTLDETIEILRRARALEALRVIRRESTCQGRSGMSMAEIDSVIAKTRKARSRKPAG